MEEKENVYQHLRDFVDEYLDRAEHGGYVCPCCNSGTHENKTGALHIYTGAKRGGEYPTGFSCFSAGCDLGSIPNRTIIEMAAYVFKEDYHGARKELNDWAKTKGISIEELDNGFKVWESTGMRYMPKQTNLYGHIRKFLAEKYLTHEIDKGYKSERTEYKPDLSKVNYHKNNLFNGMPIESLDIQRSFNFTKYVNTCKYMLEDTKYYLLRGISTETAEKLGWGYDPKWVHPNKIAHEMRERNCNETQARAALEKHGLTTPRLIIPHITNDGVIHAYEARSTRLKEFESEKAVAKEKIGKEMPLYNYDATMKKKPDVVFVVEGPIDAASFVEIGIDAISTNGTNGVEKFAKKLAIEEKKPMIVIAMDNDRAGFNGASKLMSILDEYKIPYYAPRVYEPLCTNEEKGNEKNMFHGGKDANDYLMADREGFKKSMKAILKRAKDKLRKQEIKVDQKPQNNSNELKK